MQTSGPLRASDPVGSTGDKPNGAATRQNLVVCRLTDRDVTEMTALAEAAASVAAIDQEKFWLAATTLAQELPRPVRARLNNFRLTEDAPLLLIRGYPVDDQALGPTPVHWLGPTATAHANRLEAVLALCSCLLGDPIGWAGQQEAAIIQNILPVKGDDWRQISSASRAALTLHTEDAFHPSRGDYVALMCLRNPTAVPTRYACIDDVTLPEATVRVLFEPRFIFRPDDSHVSTTAGGEGDGGATKAAVLFGAADSPYVRIDSYFMERSPDDPVATAGLTALETALAEKTASVALMPGDILVIDNYRAVHGRAEFTAQFDGTDRWLKRTNIVRDIRRSRHIRQSATARTVVSGSVS